MQFGRWSRAHSGCAWVAEQALAADVAHRPLCIGRRARSVCPELRHCDSTTVCDRSLETCCSSRACLRFHEQDGYWTDALPNKSLQPTATALSATDDAGNIRSRHAGCLRIRRAVASVRPVSEVMLGGGC